MQNKFIKMHTLILSEIDAEKPKYVSIVKAYLLDLNLKSIHLRRILLCSI